MSIKLGGDSRKKVILDAPCKLLTEWEQGYIACLTMPDHRGIMTQQIYEKVVQNVPEYAQAEVH